MIKLLYSVVVVVLIVPSLKAADPNVDPMVDWARTADPVLELPPTHVQWSPELAPLWSKALRHGESDLRRQAADSIARAHRLGMPSSAELVEELISVLGTSEQPPVVRTAAARALVTIEARRAAPLLLEHARRGPIELSLVVEPALARWDYEPARAMWLERLADSPTSTVHLKLALECLGQVREPQAILELKQLVMTESTPAVIRLAAAKALARLPASDLTEMADQLVGDQSPRKLIARLVGAHLLAHQSGDDALSLLEQYAAAAEPTVAAVAMERMLEIAPARLVERAASTLEHPDARIRQLTVHALATAPSETSIVALVPVLDDGVPEIRYEARRVLLRMSASEELRPVVIEQTVPFLNRDQWRGLEQATLILCELNQQQVGERLLHLLHHSRPEVSVTAAWGLKELAVAELAAPMFEEAKHFSAEAASEEVSGEVATHLLEAMGPMNHEPAEQYLRLFIPKSAPYPKGMRAAAIWSLGHLWAGSEQLDGELVSQLEDRLSDVGFPPELDEIRAMSAVALGRMNSEASLPTLRSWYSYDGFATTVGASCGWAIEQISGETLPKPEPWTRQLQEWFLDPAEHSAASR